MRKKYILWILIIVCLSWPVEAVAKTYTSKEAVYKIIRKNLLSHKKEFTIEMNHSVMEEIGVNTNLFETVVAIDDKTTSKDFDYLKLSLYSWSGRWKWTSQKKKATLIFSADYRTTLKQEEKLDAAIASALEELDLADATDYEKVKAIHDYIINRVSYDQSYQKHTAYHALVNKSSVCEGYALAAYRMFLDTGIDCRIIVGTADGGPHAWNIVKVDGKWYNIDLTWDDPITSNGTQVLRYDYFLKNEEDFINHTRNKEYNTNEFKKAYPIAEESYEME